MNYSQKKISKIVRDAIQVSDKFSTTSSFYTARKVAREMQKKVEWNWLFKS